MLGKFWNRLKDYIGLGKSDVTNEVSVAVPAKVKKTSGKKKVGKKKSLR